jgi:DNA-binding transcriptional LysR family regulator
MLCGGLAGGWLCRWRPKLAQHPLTGFCLTFGVSLLRSGFLFFFAPHPPATLHSLEEIGLAPVLQGLGTALVQEYHRRFPDVELTLLELTATEQIEAFDRGQLDVGFSRPLPAEPSREFHEQLVYTDYFHLVLAPAHSLARNLSAGGAIAIKRLSSERFVLLHRRSAPGVYDEVLALCRRAGNFSPHVVNEPDRMSTVLLFVESGIGVSIVAGSVRHLVRAGGRLLFCRLQPASRRPSSCD